MAALPASQAADRALLGAVTHLLWDSFTHRGTFVTNSISLLKAPTPGFAWLPVYHLLHFLSSIVGLLILARWARHLHSQPAKSLIRPYKISERARVGALWFLLVASTIAGLLNWLPYVHRRYDVQCFYAAVGTMSGFFIAWCLVAAGLWIKARER